MDVLVVVMLLVTGVVNNVAIYRGLRLFCDHSKVPLEVGEWSRALVHMDTATIENPPVSMSEGQVYVYENYFPNQTIKYIQVDNLAKKSCGASASIKAGGFNSDSVMIVLQASPHQEIRSVIDIWGTRAPEPAKRHRTLSPEEIYEMKKLKTKYLLTMRTINHNNYTYYH